SVHLGVERLRNQDQARDRFRGTFLKRIRKRLLVDPIFRYTRTPVEHSPPSRRLSLYGRSHPRGAGLPVEPRPQTCNKPVAATHLLYHFYFANSDSLVDPRAF